LRAILRAVQRNPHDSSFSIAVSNITRASAPFMIASAEKSFEINYKIQEGINRMYNFTVHFLSIMEYLIYHSSLAPYFSFLLP